MRQGKCAAQSGFSCERLLVGGGRDDGHAKIRYAKFRKRMRTRTPTTGGDQPKRQKEWQIKANIQQQTCAYEHKYKRARRINLVSV
ncbi:unnamed protein product [Ceratitis capitata]|uniref:(Mediterranean fruit fly) hypothetical protein n=1 Tax=Ceratitis capitata TaxID=7213 RepID=A0A811VHA2_CERCA|nr:unnamed protein product [Ceratitis capitata]